MIMDDTSRRISLTAWGRLYGFDKGTTSRMHHAGKLPPELQVEQLPNGRYYVVVPPEGNGRLVVYARVLLLTRRRTSTAKWDGSWNGRRGRASGSTTW